jgi:hypothetical protein
VLHDKTADRIIETVSQLSHVNATIVPFHVGSGTDQLEGANFGRDLGERPSHRGDDRGDGDVASVSMSVAGATPISELKWRDRAMVAGRIRSIRIQPWSGVPTVECSVVDDSRQSLLIVFLGRREIPGFRTGTVVSIEGRIGSHRGQLAVINPRYTILSAVEDPD